MISRAFFCLLLSGFLFLGHSPQANAQTDDDDFWSTMTERVDASLKQTHVLIADGKKKEAVALLKSQLERISVSAFEPGKMTNCAKSMDRLAKVSRELELKKPLLKTLKSDVAMKGGFSSHQLLGFYHECMGDFSVARKTYRKLLQDQASEAPENEGLRLRLLVIDLHHQGGDLVRSLQDVSKESVGMLATVFESLNWYELSPDQRINIADQLAKLHDTLKLNRDLRTKLAEFDRAPWMIRIQRKLSGEFIVSDDGEDERVLPSLFLNPMSTQKSERKNLARAKETLSNPVYSDRSRRRIKAHNRIAKRLVDDPRTALLGFTAYHLVRRIDGDSVPENELVELACEAVVNDAKNKSRDRQKELLDSENVSLFYDVDSGNCLPLTVMARFCGEDSGRRFDLLNAKLDSDAKLAEIFRLHCALISSSGEDFVWLADQLITASASFYSSSFSSDQFGVQAPDIVAGNFNFVLSVWLESEPRPPLMGLVAGRFLDDETLFRYCVGRILEVGASAADTSAADTSATDGLVKEVLASLRIRLIGDDLAQTALLKKRDGSNIAELKQVSDPLKQYAGFLQSMSGTAAFQRAVMAEARRWKLPDQFEYQEAYFDSLEDLNPDAVDRVWSEMNELGLLDDVDTFDPLVDPAELSTYSMWSRYVLSFSDELKAVMLTKLGGIQKKTFGQQLLKIELEETAQVERVYRVFADHLDELRTMPDERKAMLAQFAVDLVPAHFFRSRDESTPLTAEAQLGEKWVNDLLRRESVAAIERILSAKSLDEFSLDAENFETWAQMQMLMMDRTDKDKVVDVAVKIIELVLSEPPAHENMSPHYVSYRTVSGCFQLDDPSGNLQLVSKVLERKELLKLNVIRLLRLQVESTFKNEFETARTKIIEEGNSPVDEIDFQAICQTIDSMNKIWDGKLPAVGIPGLHRAFTNLYERKQLDPPRVLTMLVAKEESSPTEAMAIWKAVVSFWIRTHAFDRDYGVSDARHLAWKLAVEQTQHRETPLPCQSTLIEIAKDKSQPLAMRVMLARWLMYEDPTLCPRHVFACVNTICEGAEHKLGDRHVHIYCLRALERCHEADGYLATARRYCDVLIEEEYLPGENHWSDEEQRIPLLIKLYSRAKQQARVDWMVKLFRKEWPSMREMEDAHCVNALIESRQFDQARNILSNRLARPRRFKFDDQRAAYTLQLEQAMPEFLITIDNDSTRLLYDAVLSSQPDTLRQSDRPKLDQATRLRSIAKRMSEVEFVTESRRELVLVLLSGADVYLPEVATALKKKVAEMASGSSSARFEPSWFDARQLMGYLRMRALEGRHEESIKWLELIREDSTDAGVRSLIVSELTPALASRISIADQRELKSLAKALALASHPSVLDQATTQSLRSQNLTPYFTCELVLGQTDELLERIAREAEQDAAEAKEFAESGETTVQQTRRRTVVQAARLMVGIEDWLAKNVGNERENQAQRFRLAKDVWRLAANKFVVFPDESDFGSDWMLYDLTREFAIFGLAHHKILSEDELVQLGPELAAIESWEGEVWRQLGLICADRGQWNEAAGYLEKSVNAKVDKMKSMPSVRRVDLAHALIELGKLEQAKAQLEQVTVGDLYPANQRKYERLKLRLKK